MQRTRTTALLLTTALALPVAAMDLRVEGREFDLSGAPAKGDPGARLTLVEFLDYE